MSLVAEGSVYDLAQTDPEEVAGAPQMAWGVALTITSSDEADFPKEVFVFQVEDFEVDARAWFSTVATPADLLEYPVDEVAAPVEGVQQPYYRKNVVRIIGRAPLDIQETIAAIKDRIIYLERNLQALAALTA